MDLYVGQTNDISIDVVDSDGAAITTGTLTIKLYDIDADLFWDADDDSWQTSPVSDPTGTHFHDQVWGVKIPDILDAGKVYILSFDHSSNNETPYSINLRAVRDPGEAIQHIKGTGFSTDVDSLVKIRKLIDELMGSGLVAEAPPTTVSDGWIGRIIQDAREITDEPEINAKYSDTRIIRFMEQSYQKIFQELSSKMKHPVSVIYTIETDTDDEKSYVLPPYIGQVINIRVLPKSGGGEGRIIKPRSWQNSKGPGVRIEANSLIVSDSTIKSGTPIKVRYIPSGCARIHEGTCTIEDQGSTVVLDQSPTTGTYDDRLNAYGGCILRILDADNNGRVQERIIQSSDDDGKAYLNAALDPIPDGNIKYEIAPILFDITEGVVSLDVARHILSIEGNNRRKQETRQRYMEAFRSLRLFFAKQHKWDGTMGLDTNDNRRYTPRRL